ncbi:MAG: Hsp20/alpha crystallin family protein [Lachnospiraceae bacterium]|nr:Hsp20/alpha crystallin family protein [Lachnospiraceae bacterium]
MFMPSIFRDNFVEDFFDDFNRPLRGKGPAMNNIMKTDVVENENGYEISIDLPGYKKEDVTAELKDGYMTISAESKKENEEKDQNGRFIRRERFVGSCSRTFYVGDAVTEEDIKAKFEDGVLKVSVPKKVVQPEIPEKKVIAID